jgi:poly(3-hydroxybutyrate) depolymerase
LLLTFIAMNAAGSALCHRGTLCQRSGMTDLHTLIAHPGANEITYFDPQFPLRPLTLRSARPRQSAPDTPVVFVHHGRGRNGEDYRDYWLPLVDEADILVIAPEFSEASFPDSRWYNHGNLLDDSGLPNPREASSYAIDERIFAALQAQGVTRRRRYGLFGHSAGSQYVHRMLAFGYRANVAAAVAANAGTYSMPALDTRFPFGLGGIGLTAADLRMFLEFRLTVMAGTHDVDATAEHFPKDPASMLQGGTRLERAHRFVANARAMGGRLGVHCNWTIIDVPGVAHEGDKMSAAAAPILAAALHASELIAA